MSKTSIALLVLFLITLTALIVLNTSYSPNPVLKSFPKIFPTPQPEVSENTLSLSPNPLTILPGKKTSLQVIIDSKGKKPSLIQLELSYDPSVLGNVTLIPGTFYQNPEVSLNIVNARNGRISYAIAPTVGQEDTTASSVVATIQIILRPNSMKSTTALTFMPKTVVQTDEFKNTLKVAHGAKLILSSKSTPSIASPSAFLAPEVPAQLPTAF